MMNMVFQEKDMEKWIHEHPWYRPGLIDELRKKREAEEAKRLRELA